MSASVVILCIKLVKSKFSRRGLGGGEKNKNKTDTVLNVGRHSGQALRYRESVEEGGA